VFSEENVKRFLGEIFLKSHKKVLTITLVWGNGGLNIRFYVRDPETAHSWAEPRVLA